MAGLTQASDEAVADTDPAVPEMIGSARPLHREEIDGAFFGDTVTMVIHPLISGG
ncbi:MULTISPECIES: hypothetical protein [unclassified Gordonia (in: high G+C Gram-positive bacteria)]|uniref:hypothetical protein n=1 Tax=unclassified Gordonia (in: high G+C Gram-positive bacteria) TaxID=2657482 RepID=UPI001485499F|nr:MULTISPECIES: hypothetical protein [unclassified Gordonia (in: high G+C Gram-positive bacteria)]